MVLSSVRTPFQEIASFSGWLREDAFHADAAHTRKALGVMQMCQTTQMHIDQDACIRNWTDKPTSFEYHSLYVATR